MYGFSVFSTYTLSIRMYGTQSKRIIYYSVWLLYLLYVYTLYHTVGPLNPNGPLSDCRASESQRSSIRL